jgi:hypothetical protein
MASILPGAENKLRSCKAIEDFLNLPRKRLAGTPPLSQRSARNKPKSGEVRSALHAMHWEDRISRFWICPAGQQLRLAEHPAGAKIAPEEKNCNSGDRR